MHVSWKSKPGEFGGYCHNLIRLAIVSDPGLVTSRMIWVVPTDLEIECQQGYICSSCSDNEAHDGEDCLQDTTISTPDGRHDDCGNVDEDS